MFPKKVYFLEGKIRLQNKRSLAALLPGMMNLLKAFVEY
jgi:hypothetical protein